MLLICCVCVCVLFIIMAKGTSMNPYGNVPWLQLSRLQALLHLGAMQQACNRLQVGNTT